MLCKPLAVSRARILWHGIFILAKLFQFEHLAINHRFDLIGFDGSVLQFLVADHERQNTNIPYPRIEPDSLQRNP
jgi:hypothetical protein